MKPSVEHVVSHPQTHIPYETYVPVAWDLSDLEEKTQYYLDHKEERERITANAARAVEAYYNEGGFLGMMGNMIARLGL
jgi:spore maturation protein CgeB